MKSNTLELFNAVLAKTGGDYVVLPEYGVIIEPSASHAKNEIVAFLRARKLSGSELNATFHKSWAKIEKSSRAELFVHQILHYITTYGTGHTSSFVYVPDEELNVPANITFTVIRGWTREMFIEATLNMLKSGIALKRDTLNAIVEILDQFSYIFTGAEVVKNKEALMLLCTSFNAIPKDPVEFVRYLVFTATDDTLLIKNKNTYKKIIAMDYKRRITVQAALEVGDLSALASVFNRFKPIFMTFKKALANTRASAIINVISKLSKVEHVPMSYNILNNIGSCAIADLKAQRANLLNANFYQLARCIQFLKQNMAATAKIYQIRNGKCHVKSGKTLNAFGATTKISFLLDILREKYSFEGLKVYIPEDVFYALPTSEKLFVGNVPFGSKFISDNIALGVFWRNEGGARDIDLSSLSLNGKVGWNSYYNDGEVLYSGDMTNADPCATEYIYSKSSLTGDHLIFTNIYSGSANAKFNIIVGKGSDINKSYMMDPNTVWMTAATASIKKEGVVGLLTKEGDKNAAIVFNLGFGRSAVSGPSRKSLLLSSAIAERWKNCFYVNELLAYCGAEFVSSPEEADVDLSPNKLTRDSFTLLFSEKDK